MLGATPTPPLHIRPEQVQDYGAIATVHTQAFGQPDAAQLVERIRHSQQYVSDLSLVAAAEQQVVGHILLSYGQVVGQGTWPVLVLAPLGVLPSHQRQGVGRQLVQRGLRMARCLGNSLVTVLGQPGYYARLGFEPAAAHGIAAPPAVPPDALQVQWLSARQGEVRGQLQYGPAFASLLEADRPASLFS